MNRKILLVSFLLILILSVILGFFFWQPLDGSDQVQTQYAVEDAFPNLTFNSPDGLFSSGDDTNRLFVIEQPGVIRVCQNCVDASASTVFLDISERVLFSGEQGLLGLAFHPNFRQNGYFYINYVLDNPRRTIIARYSVMANNPNQADENSELVWFEISQPFSNHKGGQLAFGPGGYLYIGLGDGGSGGDPFGNGQSRTTLLGKILRVDVDSPSFGRNYGIPPDNPFAGNAVGYREEIYAYGFRNPWRFSFDPGTNRLWVADVGQNQREEIDIVEKGRNYGWNLMEGTICYSPSVGCNQTGLELPVWDYGRDEGIAVIGGYVYRGSALIRPSGGFVFGDYGSGNVWALQYDGSGQPVNTLLTDTGLNIASFGVDEQNELFICAFDGKIYKINQ